MIVEAVKESTVVNPLAARCVFWEMKTKVADPVFEKESWLSAVLYSFGDCGFSIGSQATIYFCSAEMAQGAAKLPTAPISADAAIITSVFVSSLRPAFLDSASRGSTSAALTPSAESILLDAAILNLTSRGFSAVEVFGYRDSAAAQQLLGEKPAHIGLLPVETLEASGFEVHQDHAITPRLRMELPPGFELLTASAMENFLARANA